jgi:cell division protein FtsW
MTTRQIAHPAGRSHAHLRLVAEPVREGATSSAGSRRDAALLLGSIAFLVATGLIMVLSASSVSAFAEYGDSFRFFQRQAAYALVGVVALVVTSRMRYDAWRRLAAPLFVLTLIALGLVLHPAFGVEAYGSSRWFLIGPVSVQPSEIAKLSVVVITAAVLAWKWDRLDDPGHLAIPLVPATLACFGLVLLQPDLGTTVILAGTAFLLVFVAGVRMRYLIVTAFVGSAVGTGMIMSADYRRVRLLAFLHPWEDAGNTGYQLIQSLIALGSGGLTGVGLGASRQKWQYVPNAHTDFIFSILGEELGLVGELTVVVAFGALVFAGIRIAAKAPDVFGRLLAAGIVSWLGLQALINLGAVTGLLPITGVPLPFLSYGGSSLVVSLASIGILINIANTPRSRPRGAPSKVRRP